MIPSIILISLGCVVAGFFIWSKVTNYSMKTIILKTIASLFFVALAIVCVCLNDKGSLTFKILTVIGLFFGLLGDVFLGFKNVVEKRKTMWLLLGTFSFALGHISYVIGLLNGFYVQGHPLCIVLCFTLPLLILAIYGVLIFKVGLRLNKQMICLGSFYTYCLTTMFSTALSMIILHGFKVVTLVMFAIGALNFMASDFMLIGSYFIPGKRPKWYNGLYSVFYYIAQFVIAFSIFFLV